MKIRTFYEIRNFKTFEERFDYLKLSGRVGRATFGFDRYLNQGFYTSVEWRRIRDIVITRDLGCDLGIQGYEIYDRIIVHHMNPVKLEDFDKQNSDILDPDFLICTSKKTHLAIHFGDESLLASLPKERRRGDTRLW